jgi:biotin carboxylase
MARQLLLVTPAGSYRAGDHLAAARALDCDVTVVTDAGVAIPGSAVVTSLADPSHAADRVLAALGGPVDGVVGTDGAAVTVAGELARRLGLPANPSVALRAAGNKLAQRRALDRAGVPPPAFAVLVGAETDDGDGWERAEALLPAVVKPVDRTASQGVLGARTRAALQAAVARVRVLVGADAPVLVERFVPGVEVAVEGLLRDGRLQVLALFDKPDTPTGPTFPETLLIAPARLPPEAATAVCDVVERAARAIGLVEGPVHAECRVDGDDVWFLELAARSIGGLCSRSLRIAGLSIEEVTIRHALGLAVPADRTAGATGVLMLPVPTAGHLRTVDGVERARAVDGVTGVVLTVAPGAEVTPLPDGDRYLGFVFARAGTPDACEASLRAAWARLDVRIDTGG